MVLVLCFCLVGVWVSLCPFLCLWVAVVLVLLVVGCGSFLVSHYFSYTLVEKFDDPFMTLVTTSFEGELMMSFVWTILRDITRVLMKQDII